MQLRTSSISTRKACWQVFFVAMGLAILALAPAIFRFGGRMVTRGDFMEQQIPFILETKRMLGSGMPYWDWNTFLGENFFGAYSFYTIGSPFVWLLLPLPEAAIPYGISVMAVLKHAVAALTACLYLRRFVKDARWAQIGALLYAFSGYSIINTQFYHFWDVVAVFPLLLWAVEEVFAERRRYGVLALACALNAMVNYYFYLGTAIFVAIYVVFRLFSREWRARMSFWRVAQIVFECGLGSVMAAWILMPAGWAMMGISRIGRFMELKVYETYSVTNTLERLRALIMPIESSVVHAFFGDASSWSAISAFLPLFGGAVVIWQYLARPKSGIKLLIPLLVFISLWPFTNRLFTLGSNVFYTRWWYALALMLCIPTILGMEALLEKNSRDLAKMNQAIGIVAVLSLLLTVPFLPYPRLFAWLQNSGVAVLVKLGDRLALNGRYGDYAGNAFRWLAFALAAGNLLALWAVTRKRWIGQRAVLFIALSVTIVGNYAAFIAVNDALAPAGQFSGLPTDVRYYAQHTLLDERPAFAGTTYNHRVDAPSKLRNYGMLINQPSVTAFHSLRSGYLNEFIVMAGFGHPETADVIPPDAKDGAIRSLLGVTTYYNYDEQNFPGAPEGFEYQGQEGDVSVYHNPYALPIGFGYDSFLDLDEWDVNQENFGTLALNYAIMKHYWADGGLWDVMDSVPPGTPMLSWQEAAKQRQQYGCYDVRMTPSGLTAKIDLDRPMLVGFTIQYDKGWSAKVNGEPAKIRLANMGMMAIYMTAGQATEIELTFRPRGLHAGIAVSAAAMVVWVGYMLVTRRRKRSA